jgi:hypothetical protein
VYLDDFSVVIPTRNRPLLLRRAITSAQRAGIAESRIIVVDDCSTDKTASDVKTDFPQLRLIRLGRQGGPSQARNVGLSSVRSRFSLLLDDDDTLRPDALTVIQSSLDFIQDIEKYPVFQFCRSNANVSGDFLVARLADYVHERISGDFAHIIQTQAFQQLGLSFPTTIIGGESQLWFNVAKLVGIPTWNAVVVNLHNDAPTRLCSLTSQLGRPREYALSLEQTLEDFGADFAAISPGFYRHKKAGAAIYRLLAGDRRPALRHARELYTQGYPLLSAGIFACATMPTGIIRRVFSTYRREMPH